MDQPSSATNLFAELQYHGSPAHSVRFLEENRRGLILANEGHHGHERPPPSPVLDSIAAGNCEHHGVCDVVFQKHVTTCVAANGIAPDVTSEARIHSIDDIGMQKKYKYVWADKLGANGLAAGLERKVVQPQPQNPQEKTAAEEYKWKFCHSDTCILSTLKMNSQMICIQIREGDVIRGISAPISAASHVVVDVSRALRVPKEKKKDEKKKQSRPMFMVDLIYWMLFLLVVVAAWFLILFAMGNQIYPSLQSIALGLLGCMEISGGFASFEHKRYKSLNITTFVFTFLSAAAILIAICFSHGVYGARSAMEVLLLLRSSDGATTSTATFMANLMCNDASATKVPVHEFQGPCDDYYFNAMRASICLLTVTTIVVFVRFVSAAKSIRKNRDTMKPPQQVQSVHLVDEGVVVFHGLQSCGFPITCTVHKNDIEDVERAFHRIRNKEK